MSQLSREQKKELRKELVSLFPKEKSSRMIVEDAGIPIGNIEFDNAANNNWFAIVRETGLQGMIPELIEAALDRYPDNEVLTQLLDATAEESSPSPIPAPRPGLDQQVKEVQEVLIRLISQDRLEDAFRITEKYVGELVPSQLSLVTELKARHQEILHSADRGDLRRDDELVEKNRLRRSMIQLVENLEEDSALDARVKALLEDNTKTQKIFSSEEDILNQHKIEITNGFEEIQGDNHMVGISWITKLLEVKSTVGRIWIGSKGRYNGTGFMLKGGYVLTNQHVLDLHSRESLSRAALSGSLVQFNATEENAENAREYKIDPSFYLFSPVPFNPDEPTFEQEPQAGFLDYALLKLIPNPLLPFRDIGFVDFELNKKPVKGHLANIIQHPGGGVLKFALADNKVTHSSWEHYMYYETDTLGGSSGSPVFNKDWKVVALHHYGRNDLPEGITLHDTRGVMVNPNGLRANTNRGVLIEHVLKDIQRQALALGLELPFLEELG